MTSLLRLVPSGLTPWPADRSAVAIARDRWRERAADIEDPAERTAAEALADEDRKSVV